jgi:PTS system cellobiose-specific IIA component
MTPIEEIIMELIGTSGEGKSNSMIAMRKAREGEIEIAKEYMKKASESLLHAHKIQTNLIQKEAAGEKTEISLLMIHAQDHLMNSMVIKDMANEIIALHEKI